MYAFCTLHAPDEAHLGRNRGRAFVCIKNQLLKHLEVWEDFEDLAVHSSVYRSN